jgi:hypothetical protein
MSIKSPGNGNAAQTGGAGTFSTTTVTGATPASSAGISFGTTVSGSATAGAATLPSAPLGFLEFYINGTGVVKVPYYSP